MANDRPRVEGVFFGRAGACVVEHEREASGPEPIAHEADVVGLALGAPTVRPHDHVAGGERRARGGADLDREAPRRPPKEHEEVRGAPVVDAPVGGEDARVRGGRATHVELEPRLHVVPRRAEGARHEVRARPAVDGGRPHGSLDVPAIVDHARPHLDARPLDGTRDAHLARLRIGRRRAREGHEPEHGGRQRRSSTHRPLDEALGSGGGGDAWLSHSTDSWHIRGVAAPAQTNKEKAQAWAERNTKNLQRLGYRRIVQMIVYLLVIPTVLLLAIGIFSLFLEGRINFIFGILMVAFVAVMITGMVLVLVFVRREANLSELQADFVSKVSHEFRTPLTAIRLFAETLERAKGDPETQAKCVAQLRTETERLTRLIERLLDFGRMQAGRKVYELREELVSDLVGDAEDAFAPYRTKSPDLDYASEISPEAAALVVRVDRAAVADLLVNLMSNALKYGGSPPVVRLVVRVTKEGRVAFEVSDNGEGIPGHERERIFQKFYRIDDRLSRMREGSGLGLAIVKHVARAHGAKVTIESAKERGSTFSFVLPRELVATE